MSFLPLPTILTAILADLDPARARAVELGCGDGRFTRLLQEAGCPVIGLDRTRPGLGTVATLVGDALRPPLSDGSCDLVVAANLVRHLAPDRSDLGFLSGWLALLRPGGHLFILEDQPTPRPRGARRYRQLQDFLARVVPTGRGPLLDLGTFRDRLRKQSGGVRWEFGGAVNRYPLDADAAVALLRGADLDPGGEAARLAAGIASDGLDPGRYWWAWGRRASPTEAVEELP